MDFVLNTILEYNKIKDQIYEKEKSIYQQTHPLTQYQLFALISYFEKFEDPQYFECS